MGSIWAFVIFAAVLTVTPGLDTMLVLRTAAVTGRRAGFATVTGIALGCVAWAVASALGVTALLAASRLAFDVLRVAGVGYLCWLGARALWRARSVVPLAPAELAMPDTTRLVSPDVTGLGSRVPAAPVPAGPVPDVPEPAGIRSSIMEFHAFRTGLTTNLLNPKVGVFYLSVLPQFLPPGANPFIGSLALGAIHVVEGFGWLGLVVLAVNRARGWLTRPAVRRRLEQAMGVACLGFGIRLALESGPR